MSLNIAVIVGSLRAGSYNRRLADAMTRLPVASGHRFTFADIASLPLYDQDDDADQSDSVKALKALVSGADAVMFVTPEYNRSIPGVLKNAIDCASRPYGQSAWAGKPAGVIGVSIGAAGTAMAQQHLRNVLAYLDMPTLGQPEAFIKWTDGLVADDWTISEASRDFLSGWMKAFLDFAALHAKA